MKKPILILVYILLITGIILCITGAVNDFSTYQYLTGFVLFEIGWMIVFFDIMKNKIYNKQFWVLSMFFCDAGYANYLSYPEGKFTFYRRNKINNFLIFFYLKYKQ